LDATLSCFGVLIISDKVWIGLVEFMCKKREEFESSQVGAKRGPRRLALATQKRVEALCPLGC